MDANVARLQKVEAADAARLRRFDAEVRKISAAATAGLRQALEEAAAASADAQRLHAHRTGARGRNCRSCAAELTGCARTGKSEEEL